MIEVIKKECIIINHRRQDNGDLFLVFMIKEMGFLRGILKAEQHRLVGEIPLFYQATVSFFDPENGSDLVAISYLKIMNPAQESPPAF